MIPLPIICQYTNSEYNNETTMTVSETWASKTAGGIKSSPIAADLDSDNKLERTIGSYDRPLYMLRESGSLVTSSFLLFFEYFQSSPLFVLIKVIV